MASNILLSPTNTGWRSCSGLEASLSVKNIAHNFQFCIFKNVAIWFQFVLLSPLVEKFLKTKTITSIQTTNYPISEIDFPAISVCSNTRVSKSRYEAAMKNSKLPWKNLTDFYNVQVSQVVASLVMFDLHGSGLNYSDDSLVYRNYSEYLTGLMAAVTYSCQ